MKLPDFDFPDRFQHPRIRHPYAGLNNKLADKISAAFGSMGMFWSLVCWMLGWMLLAQLGFWIFGSDKYPFAFLLFLSNLVQLWALPVLGTTQNRADEKRNAKADADHEANVYLATRTDENHAMLTVVVEWIRSGQQKTPSTAGSDEQ